MDANSQQKIQELRRLVGRGEYRVDPRAVADAMIARHARLSAARGRGPNALATPQVLRAARRARALSAPGRAAA